MEWGLAQSCVEILRAVKDRDPVDFATLVAIVRPRGAKAPAAGVVTPEALWLWALRRPSHFFPPKDSAAHEPVR